MSIITTPTTTSPLFSDAGGPQTLKPRPWEPLLVPREAIEEEIERLADQPAPSNGLRASRIVHPRSATALPGMSPGTDVTIQVLKPGEETLPVRRNTNQIELCLRGSGVVNAGEVFAVQPHDVWNLPSMRAYSHRNTGPGLWVRLTYSNAPLLEWLGVLFSEEGAGIREEETEQPAPTTAQKATYVREAAPIFPIGTDGALFCGYEFLTDIRVAPNKSLHWPWREMSPHMSAAPDDGKRRIHLLYNPSTEQRNGTSNSFFATYGGCPPGSPPFKGLRGHRHTSASINYHTRGYGKSVVDGVTVEWREGDLLFSAPSWAEHAHYPGPEGWTVLTVQDHPMHIALGSLLWQEKMQGPIHALGLEKGQTGYTGPREIGS